MKNTVSIYDFRRAFEDYNRGDNFSYEGLGSLFEYFEELESSCNIEIELDVIAICCEFTEYENLEEVQGTHPDIESLDDLYECTQVIEMENGGIIIQDY